MAARKSLKIQGPFHPLNLKLQKVTTLTKKFEKNKDFVLHGLWDEKDNTLYLGSDTEESVKLHTLCHELSHMLWKSFQRLEGEEAAADVLGAYLIKISGCKTANELIERLRVKE